MSFIFHSKKQSIFNRSIPKFSQQQLRKIVIIQHKKNQSPRNYKINMEVSRQHPFRKKNYKQTINKQQQFEGQFQQTIDQFQKQRADEKQINKKNNLINQFLLKQTKQKKKQVQLRIKNGDNLNDSTMHSLEDSIKKCFPQIVSTKSPDKINQLIDQISIQQIKRLKKIGQFKKQISTLKQQQQQQDQTIQQNYENQDDLRSHLGPGSYDIKYPSSQKVTISYNHMKTFPLCPKKSINQLIEQIARKQNPGKQRQKHINFQCNYKNQSSAFFKNKSHRGQLMKKNGSLLSKIFCKKQDKQQQQTACQSRHVIRSKIQDDQFQINNQRSPSPCNYSSSKSLIKHSHNQKNGASIAGTDKPNFTFVNTDQNIASTLNQQHMKEQVFNQNQNKKQTLKNKKANVRNSFLSTVPRQLHFDTQNLCSQQFWYSPKNNLTDILQTTVNERSKLKFGSTIRRFQCDKIDQTDPYKYCQAKIKFLDSIPSKHNNNIASLKYTQKRELFKSMENNLSNNNQNVSPFNYAPQNHTIKQYISQTISKNQIQMSYKNFTNSMKEKKKILQNTIMQKQKQLKTFQQYKQKYQNINPDRYKNYLKDQQNMEKQNISFGMNKLKQIDRAIMANKTLDIYYQVQPGWKIGSFNKFYGLQVFQG